MLCLSQRKAQDRKEPEYEDLCYCAKQYNLPISMIEKEAVVDSERSFISSVIYNRIAIGMPLQIDATVIYSYGYHIEKMYEKYLEIDSPYNTYMYYGLPIGPISNPGRASLMAALKPKETDYLYYLLESENTHYFTDNYDDFLRRKEELGY